MLLEYLQIKNFKSLQKIEIKPKKITILIGPNSSGKSSILQVFALLKQSVMSSGGGYFRTKGGIVNLGEFIDVISDHDDTKNVFISTKGKINLSDVENHLFGKGPAKFQYGFSVGNEGTREVWFSLQQGSLNIEFETRNGIQTKGNYSISRGTGKLLLANSQNLLQGYAVSEFPSGTEIEKDVINRLLSNSELIKKLFTSYYFVPPSRTMDEYGLPVVNVSDDQIVTSMGQRANLSRLVSYLSSSPPNVTNMISDWTYRLFGKRIKTRNVPTYSQENKEVTNVTVEFLEDEHYNSIINDGSGTNQVILLLTLLGTTPKGSVLGIEEPEIHLHPKAQADLAKIIIEISKKDDKQILFTTHSEHMLYPFLTSIASKDEDSLALDDVAIFYCEKDPVTKKSTITLLDVDQNGMISGGLKGFFESEIVSLQEYLKALEHD